MPGICRWLLRNEYASSMRMLIAWISF